MKLDNTKKAFIPAIRSAIVTVNGPKWKEVTLIVSNVQNIRTNKIFARNQYSIVCVVLLAILLILKIMKLNTLTGKGKSRSNRPNANKVHRFRVKHNPDD